MRRPGLKDRIARVVLTGLEPTEVESVLQDLRELSADRGRIGGEIYFWLQLVKYPARMVWDQLRYGDSCNDGYNRGDGSSRNNDVDYIEGQREGWSGMDSWWKDARDASRSLVRNVGFTALAVAIVTLGMGSAAAIFSVVKGVLLDPLPVEEPDRLVSLWLDNVVDGRARMTPGNFTDLAALEDVFLDAAAFRAQTTSLLLEGEPVFLRGGAVTPSYFETLGVRPVAGRTFRQEEGETGGPSVVILSHHVWQQMFGADPNIVGQSLTFDGFEFEVVGVVPSGVYPTRATIAGQIPFTTANQDFFVPLRYSPGGWSNRRSHLLGMLGRLRPGVSFETAQAATSTLGARLHAEDQLNSNEQFVVTTFTSEVVGDVRFGLLMLLGTVGLVLLIATVNVGALFVLRADDRQPEMAIRVALGAPRGRLFRQLAIESALISAVSCVGSVIFARWALGLMRGLVPYQIPRLAEVGLNGSSMVVIVGLGLLIAAVFGLAPALRLDGEAWTRASQQRSRTAGLAQRRLQSAVVAIQAALGVVVLVGAALLTRSYMELHAVDTGFDAYETWAMTINAPLSTLQEIAREARGLPGVTAVAVAYDHPLDRNWSDAFFIEGVEVSDTERPPMMSLRPFGEQYFDATGIETVEGRVPDEVDMAGSVPYAVINEALRDAYFAAGDAIGARVVLPSARRLVGTDGAFEIVGVVRDVRFLGPDQPTSPALYVPLSHFPTGASTLLVRPARADVDVLAGVRRIVRETDPTLAVQRAQGLQSVLDDMLARPRFNMMLLVSFGIMGLVLCALGAYGLVGRVVVMRFREIGIRMALGADRAGLARSVIGSALRPMLLGGLVGLATSLALARLIQSMLFGVSSTDAVSFVVSPALVLAAGAIAALVPTMRVLAIDPSATLRNE